MKVGIQDNEYLIFTAGSLYEAKEKLFYSVKFKNVFVLERESWKGKIINDGVININKFLDKHQILNYIQFIYVNYLYKY